MFDFILTTPETTDHREIENLYKKSVRLNEKGFVQDLDFHGSVLKLLKLNKDNSGYFVVAKANDKIIGIGALKATNTSDVELCKLHVDPEFQKCGVGNKISRYLLKKAKSMGYKNCHLHVTTTQNAAIRLYKNIGFECSEVKPWFYNYKGIKEQYETQYMFFSL